MRLMAVAAALLLVAAVLLALAARNRGPFMPTPEPDPAPAPQPAVLPGGHGEWDNQIRYAASAAGLPLDSGPLVVKAIIEHESAHTWDPEVLGDYDAARCPSVYTRHPEGYRPGRGRVSTAGYCALGLMQVHRYWHPTEAALYDLLDGNENILAGAFIVGGLWRSFGDWSKVLAAYNGGADAGNAYPQVSDRVRNYVANVGGTVRRYASVAGVTVAV